MFNFMNRLVDLNMNYAMMNGPIQAPTWLTPNKVVWTDGKTELREVRKGANQVVIVTPESGHSGHLADLADTRSLVQCALNNQNGGVYVVNKLPANETHSLLGISYCFTSLWEALSALPGRFDLIGLSQGGWQAGVVADSIPHRMKSLTIAGSPMISSAAPSSFTPILNKYSQQDCERFLVGGNLPGNIQLMVTLPDNPCTIEMGRWSHADDPDFREFDRRFRNWYYSPQDIPGLQTLEVVQKVFRDDLMDHYSLHNIRCPVNLIGGSADVSVPIPQVFGMQKACPQAALYEVDEDHHGLFLGAKTIATVWTEIFKAM